MGTAMTNHPDMTEPYIIDAVRTAIGNLGGGLSSVRADDLAAIPIRALLQRNPGVDPAAIDDVILGCANQAGEDNRNVARMALLLAGLPVSVPGETVNRLCASGMSAVVNASRAIRSGDGHLFIAGGVEHMTRGPWVMSKSSRPFGNDAQLYDSTFGWRFVNPLMREKFGAEAMGETAENLVDNDHISREEQDAFAWGSQQKAAAAQQDGYFASEIVPVDHKGQKGELLRFDQDEFIKPWTTKEKLAELKPAFRKPGGTVTAGNASGLNDGSAALLLASGDAIKRHALQPRARIVSSAVVGVEPRIMGIGPVEASRKALVKAGLRLSDIDLIECNEAFAAQTLAVLRSLGIAADDPRVNPHGGAIALGHPLGMSGARIIQTAVHGLHHLHKRYALATMCVGVGQGYAVVLERL
jgi:3-oxoadipyl-CoA thiolase